MPMRSRTTGVTTNNLPISDKSGSFQAITSSIIDASSKPNRLNMLSNPLHPIAFNDMKQQRLNPYNYVTVNPIKI
jgi:hypothetical protein